MSILPWSLVILSGLIHALWNLKVKQVSDRTLYLAVAYTCAGLALFPAALAADGLYLPAAALAPVLLSAAAESLYVVTLSKAYSVSDLTFVYPIARGSAPVLAAVAGALFFQESLSPLGLAAVMVIITGILTVGLNTGKGSARALLLSLAVGVFIGCYTSLDRWAIEYVSVYSLLFWKFTVAGVILLAARIRDPSFAGAVRENFVMSALTGMFILAAYFLVVLAMKHSNLGYVAAGREIGIAFSTLFGYLILRERIKARGLAGIVTLFLGIVLLRFA